MIDTLVTTDWLNEHLNDPDLTVLDCTVMIEPDGEGSFRRISGRANYDAGHIPGAGFADLTGDLSDITSALMFALPTPEAFCAAMGGLGVGAESRVVLYDSRMSMWAARVWWMLRWVGFDNAALLDGGQQVWVAEDRPLSTEQPATQAKQLNLSLRPELIADEAEVLAATKSGGATCLIDSLMDDHYRGDMTMYKRPGHIPGAINASAIALLDPSGRYLSQAELEARHQGDRDARTITYCGGGIAASSTAFIMTRLGFSDVAVYAASLQEWAANPNNPMALGGEET